MIAGCAEYPRGNDLGFLYANETRTKSLGNSISGRYNVGMAFLSHIEDESGRVLAELITTHNRYVLPDGTETFVTTDKAWCRHCNEFVLVERLETPEALEKQARDFHAMRKSSPAFLDVEIADRLLENSLHRAQQWRIALASRRSPPRCLQCAGTDFVVLPPDENWVEHPGGLPIRVRARLAHMHMSMCESGSRYDTAGLIIPSEERDDVENSPAFIESIERARQQAKDGKTISHRELKAKLDIP